MWCSKAKSVQVSCQSNNDCGDEENRVTATMRRHPDVPGSTGDSRVSNVFAVARIKCL
jgi:hypothetical protein